MQAKQRTTRDTVVASASVQRTPRVSVVLSSYKGGGDHFGNATFAGLPEPRPASAELTETQLRALARKAIELGNHPSPGLRRIVSRDESVVLLANRYAEPAVVLGAIDVIKETAPGAKVTIVSDAPSRFTGAPVVDLSTAEMKKMPAPGVWSRREVTYTVPKAILDCDRLITVAPLRVEKIRPSLTIDNYRVLTGAKAAPNNAPDLAAIDLYGFHPADFAVLGGSFILRNGTRMRHNLVLAGAMASAVDTVGTALLRMKPEGVRLLQTASERYGKTDLDEIWTLGNEIEDARLPA
jgi:hypothetical protein